MDRDASFWVAKTQFIVLHMYVGHNDSNVNSKRNFKKEQMIWNVGSNSVSWSKQAFPRPILNYPFAKSRTFWRQQIKLNFRIKNWVFRALTEIRHVIRSRLTFHLTPSQIKTLIIFASCEKIPKNAYKGSFIYNVTHSKILTPSLFYACTLCTLHILLLISWSNFWRIPLLAWLKKKLDQFGF